MFLNIILILLIYKALSNEGTARKKYIVLFSASFLVASVLFLYFEFFSHMNGADIYEEVVAFASSLRYDGTYHVDVVDKEILGIDLSDREIAFRKNNCVQFPAFIILMLPYILLAVRFFKNVIKSAETKLDKCKYMLVSIGAATIIPDLLLKCDYGRWMFAIICYYCVITIALLGMKDAVFERELKKLVEEVTANRPWMILLLIYPILLQPLQDVSIIEITRVFARTLNRELLHWW